MNDQHFRNLERIFLSAPTNVYYDPRIRISEGEATILIPVKEAFFHGMGAVHGSVYFKALDDAAFFAANSVVGDVFMLTASFQIYLLRPVFGGTITAKGRVVVRSTRQIIAEAVALDDEDNEVARGSGAFMRSDFKLTDAPGWGAAGKS